MENKATLLLDDGTIFEGEAIGATGTTTGEICFNTGLTGYQEVFTDPSYFGQLIVMTFPHIGNYGTAPEEIESGSVKIKGLICKEFSKTYSRDMADQSLQSFFEANKIVGITGIDTRQLVRHIRDKGAMNAIISSEGKSVETLKNELNEVPSMAGLSLSQHVSTQEPYDLGEEKDGFKVAVLDFGVKKNILRNFTKRNCQLRVFPMGSDLKDIEAWQPDGYFLSNGPGDPEAMVESIDLVKQVLELDKPIFGICLGHQLLCLANGLTTYKMHSGHRGLNHPVKNLITGKCEVTSQNHGFAVDAKSIENNPKVELTHINLNDNTVEGIRIKDKNIFSVQHHPEASPGPHDSDYLFDQFITMLEEVTV